MSRPNFELITELQTLTRRDFPLADVTLLSPVGANPLLDGEWLELDTNYKLARKPEITGHAVNSGEGSNLLVFPVFAERGRYDTQAIGKTTVLMFGSYEAETHICDGTGAAVGDPLAVTDVTVDTVANKRGLKKVVAGSGIVIVGYVTKVISLTKLRFIHFVNVLE